MEYLTKEQFMLAILSREEVERKLNKIRQTLTPENSRIALCGNCRYNDEMEEIYRYNCYPYCNCHLTPKHKGLMILYSPENTAYEYSYARELITKCMSIIALITNYIPSLKWYNFRTKRRAEWALMQLNLYMLSIYDHILAFDLRKKSNKQLNNKQIL